MLAVTGWRKDAEGAGKWAADHIRTKKGRTEVSADTIFVIARWAGHWGIKELARFQRTGDETV